MAIFMFLFKNYFFSYFEIYLFSEFGQQDVSFISGTERRHNILNLPKAVVLNPWVTTPLSPKKVYIYITVAKLQV